MLENWSSRDVQADPEGFRKAQQLERERIEDEARKQREADDLERFTQEFVAEGGDPRDAESEWRRTRTERASERAAEKSQAAMSAMIRTRMRQA